MHRVVLIGHDNQGAKKIIARCITENPELEFKVIITQGIYYKKNFASSVIKLIQEASIIFCFNRMMDLIRDAMFQENLATWCRKNRVKFKKTKDVNDEQCLFEIKKFRPSLIVSTFTTHILTRELIDSATIATIGTHPSRIPEYRGLEVFFWQLANNEKSSAISLFTMTDKIDTGQLIECTDFLIAPKESVRSLYEKISLLTAERMSLNIKKILQSGKVTEVLNTNDKSSYYGMPNRAAFKKFRKTGRKWN